jgi:aryl-alcohol dehydrogenase-like predicted oxidoreductase
MVWGMERGSFTRRFVPALGREMHRLGLAANYGIEEAAFEAALEAGQNYVFWTALRTGRLRAALRRVLAKKRAEIVLASGPSVAYFGGSVTRAVERLCQDLDTDYIDVFQLFWLGVGSAWTQGTVDALLELKARGKVRAIGVSIHDRKRAGELAAASPLDLLMVRYNAAHPGAEADIFPRRSGERPAVVAYTATAWRRLLKAPSGWSGGAMSAGDCYRFCLSNPAVDIVLTGPKSGQELAENLAALEQGPLSAEEESWMRAFGRQVHG